ncbi:hypothetical protein OXX80_013461 [Metschnikowia pulcherrima]
MTSKFVGFVPSATHKASTSLEIVLSNFTVISNKLFKTIFEGASISIGDDFLASKVFKLGSPTSFSKSRQVKSTVCTQGSKQARMSRLVELSTTLKYFVK